MPGLDADLLLAAAAAQAETPRLHGGDVLRPLVDQGHVAAGPREEAPDHAADRARPDDADAVEHAPQRGGRPPRSRRVRTASASSCSTGTVISQLMQASVML